MQIEYHNLYTHLILITKNRLPLIGEQHRERIEKYATGVVGNTGSKLYCIYANPEHIHLLISRSPKVSEEAMAITVAAALSKFINENKLCTGNFAWQESASAFSVSKSDVEKVCRYIQNQKEHHRKVNFGDEYEKFKQHYQQTIKWGVHPGQFEA